MVFIAASEKPNILKLTSLQLTVFNFNASKSSSFVKFSEKLSVLQTNDSLKKTLLYPKMIES